VTSLLTLAWYFQLPLSIASQGVFGRRQTFSKVADAQPSILSPSQSSWSGLHLAHFGQDSTYLSAVDDADHWLRKRSPIPGIDSDPDYTPQSSRRQRRKDATTDTPSTSTGDRTDNVRPPSPSTVHNTVEVKESGGSSGKRKLIDLNEFPESSDDEQSQSMGHRDGKRHKGDSQAGDTIQPSEATRSHVIQHASQGKTPTEAGTSKQAISSIESRLGGTERNRGMIIDGGDVGSSQQQLHPQYSSSIDDSSLISSNLHRQRQARRSSRLAKTVKGRGVAQSGKLKRKGRTGPLSEEQKMKMSKTMLERHIRNTELGLTVAAKVRDGTATDAQIKMQRHIAKKRDLRWKGRENPYLEKALPLREPSIEAKEQALEKITPGMSKLKVMRNTNVIEEWVKIMKEAKSKAQLESEDDSIHRSRAMMIDSYEKRKSIGPTKTKKSKRKPVVRATSTTTSTTAPSDVESMSMTPSPKALGKKRLSSGDTTTTATSAGEKGSNSGTQLATRPESPSHIEAAHTLMSFREHP
jgi:hypothetical protein